MDKEKLQECKKRVDEINDEIKNIVETASTETRELTDDEQLKLDELKSEKEDLVMQIENLIELSGVLDEVIDEVIETVEQVEEVAEPEEVKDEENGDVEPVVEAKQQNSKTIDKNKLNKNIRLMENKEKVTLGSILRKSYLREPLNDAENAVLQRGRNEMTQSGVMPLGDIVIPSNRAAYQATVTNQGIENVATEIQDIVQPAWAKQVLKSAGATFYSGLVGDQQFPLMGKTNVGWQTEIGAAIDGAGQFAAVIAKPKRLTCYVDISKQMLIQDNSQNLETYIMSNLVSAIADKLEATLLSNVAGTANMPAGIFSTFAPGTLTPTWAEVVGLEGLIEGNDLEGKSFIVNPTIKSALKTTAIDAGSGIMIQVGNEANGYPVYSTSNSFGLAFGYWDKYVVCNWGGTDITVDPYTQAVNGCIRLVVNTYWDAVALWDSTATATGHKAPIVTTV